MRETRPRRRGAATSCRRAACEIAIDDFGTGYSSLTYLRRFPVDMIKIDKSFVADVDVSKESEAIMRAITAMANSLGLKTVAEGVERHPVHNVREMGCDLGQGYWLARPEPLASLMELLITEP